MTPYYSDSWLTVYQGDCREVMASMEPESVHCVVTSPPYWGLRDYGTATWLGGLEGCDHRVWGHAPDKPTPGGRGGSMPKQEVIQRETCGKCGATRQDSQLGLEPTPEEYVANMVAVFREVRRVLRADGTVWLNLGDSYSGSGKGGNPDDSPWKGFVGNAQREEAITKTAGEKRIPPGLKPKDLVGIPWRVAFALQADGWYLRSDIIWSKPNPMPESVTDRPTKAHEYLFLLTKSARYFYDADAVREAALQPSGDAVATGQHKVHDPRGNGASYLTTLGTNQGAAGRNIRSVWTVATQPYPGAHFATFPEALVEPCVKAGTSERGVCPECGAPWERETEKSTRFEGGSGKAGRSAEDANANGKWAGKQYGANIKLGPVVDVTTTGWRPGCGHDLPTVGAVVLDPFAGSGTVGRVAQRLSRRAVLIDLNADYLVQAMTRNQDIPLGLETA